MRKLKEQNYGISTLLAFALIPLSGFATDIYIPSLPSMATYFHLSTAAIQTSVIIFMISSGITQLFIGGILDSYGRFTLNISSLGAFALASFLIGWVPNIYFLYAMRLVQGIAVSMIIVGKRAFFVDVYQGEKLKHYTSLFSIIWATAPIVAPFIGGYLQQGFGWKASFYFLGIATILIMLLELKFSGETLKTTKPFQLSNMLQVYRRILRTTDFTLGLLIIGASYSLLVIYGMTGPFIIEKVFHYSPVISGYSSLLSGVSLMTGGIISKLLLNKPIVNKLIVALGVTFISAFGMLIFSPYYSNLVVLLLFTLVLHLASGFIFNIMYAYCLRRFTEYAGTTSGLTGSGIYIVSSIIGYGLIHQMTINSQLMLAIADLIILSVLLIGIIFFIKALKK